MNNYTYLLLNCLYDKKNPQLYEFIDNILDYGIWTNNFIIRILTGRKNNQISSYKTFQTLIKKEKWGLISNEVKEFAKINHRRQIIYNLSQKYNIDHKKLYPHDEEFSDERYM